MSLKHHSVHTVSLFFIFFYKSGRYDLLCNSLYNATYRKENNTNENCTKQHWAEITQRIFFTFLIGSFVRQTSDFHHLDHRSLQRDRASIKMVCALKKCSFFLLNWQQDQKQ